MAIWVIVPAAGIGARMQAATPKQYLHCNGRAVIVHTLERLNQLAGVSAMVVALHPDDPDWQSLEIATQRPVLTVVGGAERARSVMNALESLEGKAAQDDWILVHDAVRPCVRVQDIQCLLEAVASHPCGGLLAIPVSSTLKRAGIDGNVAQTLSREGVWQAATPQAVRFGILKEAYQRALAAGMLVTDESAALEFSGYFPHLIRCSADNIKITFPEDLSLAGLILDAQSRENEMTQKGAAR